MAMVAAVTMAAVVAGTTAVAVAVVVADTMAVAVNANSGSAADAVEHMGR